MHVVPRVTGLTVAGKDHADETFFNRDHFADFELRFVRAACNRPMWWWLLRPSPL
jgi:hypothetical protein